MTKLYSASEVADILRVSVSTVKNTALRLSLAVIRSGKSGAWCFTQEQIEKLRPEVRKV